MANDAMFTFATNIDEVAARIERGYRQIETVAARGLSPDTQGLDEFAAHVRRTIETSLRQFDRMQNTLARGRSLPGGGGSLTDATNRQYAQTRQTLSRTAGESGLSKSDTAKLLQLIAAEYRTVLRDARGRLSGQVSEYKLGSGKLDAPDRSAERAAYAEGARITREANRSAERGQRQTEQSQQAIAAGQEQQAKSTRRAATADERTARAKERVASKAERDASAAERTRGAQAGAQAATLAAETAHRGPQGRDSSDDFTRNLDRLTGAFDRAARAKDSFMENLRQLQGVFEQGTRTTRAATRAEGARTEAIGKATSAGAAGNLDPRFKSSAARSASAARKAAEEGPDEGIPLLDQNDRLLDRFRRISRGRFYDLQESDVLQYGGKNKNTGVSIENEGERFEALRQYLNQTGQGANRSSDFERLERAAKLFEKTTTDGLAPLVRRIAANLYEDRRSGQTQFVRTSKSGADLVNDPQGLAEARRAAKATDARELAETRRNQLAADRTAGGHGGRGIVGSFFSGFSSPGFGGGGPGNGQGGFLANFDPEGLARSAGISAKYAALGSALFLVESAAAQAGQEILDFSDSVTELEVALQGAGESTDVAQGFINDLSDSATRAGVNVGEAMDLAASAIRTFKDQVSDTPGAVQAMATSFAAEAAKIAVISKTDIADAAGNLKAISLAFDIPVTNFARVTDLLAGAKQAGGGDEKNIGQGVASLGVAFKEVGFSAEETGAIVSKVIAATDQSGQLVATRLSRITSIIGGASGRRAIENLNASLRPEQQIDVAAPIRDQIQQLGQVYGQLGEAQRAQLVNQLGGTANARELIVLLQNVNGLIQEADDGFSGRGAEEYRKRLQDIRATLTQIRGELRNIVSAIAQSGILDPFAALVKFGLLPALEAIRQILNTFNLIPRPIRTAAATLATMLLTLRAIQAVRAAGGVSGFLRGVEATVAPTRGIARNQLDQLRTAQAATAGASGAQRGLFRTLFGTPTTGVVASAAQGGRLRLDAIRGDRRIGSGATAQSLRDFRTLYGLEREEGAGRLRAVGRAVPELFPTLTQNRDAITGAGRAVGRGLRGLPSAAGRLLSSELGPLGLGIAGFGAAQATYGAGQDLRKQLDAVRELQNAPFGASAAELRDAAANFATAAAALNDSSSGFLGSIVDFVNNNDASRTAQGLNDQALANRRAADELSAFRRRRGEPGTVQGLADQFDFTSNDAFDESLKSITESGRSATDIMAAFQLRLQGIAQAGDGANVALTDMQQATIRINTGARSVGFLNALKSSQATDAARAATLAGRINIGNPNLAAAAATAETLSGGGVLRRLLSKIPGVRDVVRTPGEKATENLSKIEAPEFQATTEKSVRQFFEQGGDVRDDTGKDALKKLLVSNYLTQFKKYGLSDAEAAKLAGQAVGVVVQETREVTSLTDTNVSVEKLAAAAPQLAQTAAGEARTKNILRGSSEYADVTEARTNRDQLALAVTNLESRTGLNEDEKRRLDGLREQLRVADIAYDNALLGKMQAKAALSESLIPAEDTARVFQERLHGANGLYAQLAAPGTDQAQRDQIQAQINQAEQEAERDRVTGLDPSRRRRLNIDSRDTVGTTRAAVKAARDQTDRLARSGLGRGDPAYDQAVLGLREAVVAAHKAEVDNAISKNNVRAFPESALDTATRNLRDARARLVNMRRGSDEYYQQLAAINQAERELARGKIEAASLQRQLNIDLSNPIQVAQEALRTAQDQRDLVYQQVAAAGNSLTPEAAAQLRGTADQDVRQKQLSLQQAKEQDFLSTLKTADDLGRITHEQYMQGLDNEMARVRQKLDGMKRTDNGYKDLQNYLDQLEEAAKSAADQMQGQFNLGDIDVPTPYEVRRAIRTGDSGSILRNNSPFSTGGNVTNDNSTQNVILNGVSLETVLNIIEKTYGKKARAKAARRVS